MCSNKKTVLLVEDEALTAAFEKQQLENFGYSVIHVSNGDDAVQYALSNDYCCDVILIDIDLGPGMDGTQAAREILKGKDIPVVFLSSHTELEIVEKTEKITSYGYVVKNTGIVVLDASIKMALKLFDEKKERDRVENVTQAERDQLLSIFNSIDEVIYIADPQTHEMLYANSALQKKMAADYIGDKCYRVLQNLDAPCPFCTNDIILKEKYEPYYWEFYNRIHDRHYEIVDRIIRWPDGRDVRFEMAIDITDRKHIEEALRESEERYRALSESGLIFVYTHDLRGNFIDASDATLDLLGYTREEIPSLNFASLVSGDQLEKALLVLKEFETTGRQSVPGEYRLHSRAGHDVYIETIASPVYHNGEIVALTAIATDITERKRAEEALRESEERFKALHNASFGGIAIHDRGIILECNQGLADMTGYSVAELTGGMDGLLLIAEKSREDVMSKIKSGYEKPYEAIGVRKNGEEYPMRLEARNVHYKGQPVRTVEFRDITEIKRAEEEIKLQLSEKETLLKEIHHRIKNHIASIEGLLSIQADSTDNAEVKSAFQDSIARIQSTRVLYEKLMISGDYQEVSTKNYIESLIDSLVDVFPQSKSVSIDKKITDFILSSKKAMPVGIIINELFTNIFKYAFEGKEGGAVLIKLEKEENMVTLTINDNGTGIIERDDKNRSPGFGLTIVKMLTEQLRGTYTVENVKGVQSVVKFEI